MERPLALLFKNTYCYLSTRTLREIKMPAPPPPPPAHLTLPRPRPERLEGCRGQERVGRGGGLDADRPRRLQPSRDPRSCRSTYGGGKRRQKKRAETANQPTNRRKKAQKTFRKFRNKIKRGRRTSRSSTSRLGSGGRKGNIKLGHPYVRMIRA